MKKIILVIIVVIFLSTIGYLFRSEIDNTFKCLINNNSFFNNNIVKRNYKIKNEKEALDWFLKATKYNDPDNTSCQFDKETGYYVISWSNPGGGTGGSWYVNPLNGDILDCLTKKKITFK